MASSGNREPREIRERSRAFGKGLLHLVGAGVPPPATPFKLPIFAWFAWFAVHLNSCFTDQYFARRFARWRGFWRVCTQAAPRGGIRFQKYRVAPRLGTDTVRRRLLRGLHEQTTLTATETGCA